MYKCTYIGKHCWNLAAASFPTKECMYICKNVHIQQYGFEQLVVFNERFPILCESGPWPWPPELATTTTVPVLSALLFYSTITKKRRKCQCKSQMLSFDPFSSSARCGRVDISYVQDILVCSIYQKVDISLQQNACTVMYLRSVVQYTRKVTQWDWDSCRRDPHLLTPVAVCSTLYYTIQEPKGGKGGV